MRQDSMGPIVKTVSDAAALLQAIAGKDENNAYTLEKPFATPLNYMKALNKNALKERGSKSQGTRSSLLVLREQTKCSRMYSVSHQGHEQAVGTVVQDTTLSSFNE